MAFLRSGLLQTTGNSIWGGLPFPSQPTILTSTYSPASTVDGDMVKEYHSGLTIDEGVVFRPENRCKGMLVVVNGDLSVNGTLSMTARGAKAEGDDIAIDYEKADVILNPEDIGAFEYAVGAGGAGGARWSAKAYKVGRSGSMSASFGCGGGGSGAIGACGGCNNNIATSGAGAAGTSYSGGSGGGGSSVAWASRTATGGAANGGAGGKGAAYDSGGAGRGGGGGAGNSGGAYYRHGSPTVSCSYGGNGTGGLLIVLVSGDIIIGPNGKIEANGMNGGYALHGTNKYGAGGGASGGGSINVFYAGALVNEGSIHANGGTGGSGTARGGAGGAGTVRVEKISL